MSALPSPNTTASGIATAVEDYNGFTVDQPVAYVHSGWLIVPATITRLYRDKYGAVRGDVLATVPIQTMTREVDQRTGLTDMAQKWERQQREFLRVPITNLHQLWDATEVPIANPRPEQRMIGTWAEGDTADRPQVEPVHLKNIGGFFDPSPYLWQVMCYRGKRELTPGVIDPPVTEYVPADGGLTFTAAWKKLWKQGFKHPRLWDRVVLRCVG